MLVMSTKIWTLGAIASVWAALLSGSGSDAQTTMPVHTQSGLVQGIPENGVTAYKGIPFAAPPIGDLRWQAPKPPMAWKGVRNGDKFAPACMQVPLDIAPGMRGVATNEDCLYLNIWTPAKSPTDRLAVMVSIYGGGFVNGASSIATYNGANLAKKGVVVVSLSYRLGAFGFLAHPQLTAEQKGHSGNYGLLDQIAALQWVKRNIASFGGDPHRVTIFGESAGGISVSMLAASPLAKGLFQGLISESGGNFGPQRQDDEGGESMDSLAAGEKNGVAFLAKLGAASIADARRRPAEDILKSSSPVLGAWWPIFDGYVLMGDQYKLYEAGRFNNTPVLIGTNSDEGALFVPSITSAVYQAGIRSDYGEYADKILAAYPVDSDAVALRSARDLFRDTTFAWPTWAWARLQSQAGKGAVYLYYFSHRPAYPDLPRFKDMGAPHAGELPFVFGNFSAVRPPTATDRALSEAISSYWVNFAKTGNPNGSELLSWPAFTAASAQVINLNDPSKVVPVPNLEKLEVLDGYYAWRRAQAERSH
jgi:para-nitrobenzyl esterase